MLRKLTIEVEDFGSIRADPGLLLLEILNAHGLDLHNDCGGQGTCGKCRIVFRTTPPVCLPGDHRHLTAAERAAGVRLACFHQAREDCAISIPPPPPVQWFDDTAEDLVPEI